MTHLTERQASEKLCPFRNHTCVASYCMCWQFSDPSPYERHPVSEFLIWLENNPEPEPKDEEDDGVFMDRINLWVEIQETFIEDSKEAELVSPGNGWKLWRDPNQGRMEWRRPLTPTGYCGAAGD